MCEVLLQYQYQHHINQTQWSTAAGSAATGDREAEEPAQPPSGTSRPACAVCVPVSKNKISQIKKLRMKVKEIFLIYISNKTHISDM